VSDLLDDAGVTLEETKAAVAVIAKANADLTLMTERFDAFASANTQAFQSLAEAQTGEGRARLSLCLVSSKSYINFYFFLHCF